MSRHFVAQLSHGCQYVPLCAIVCHCVPLCAIVCLCVPLCDFVCHCVPLCVFVCHCVPLCAIVCFCVPLCAFQDLWQKHVSISLQVKYIGERNYNSTRAEAPGTKPGTHWIWSLLSLKGQSVSFGKEKKYSVTRRDSKPGLFNLWPSLCRLT
jgi:hypothetical protein